MGEDDYIAHKKISYHKEAARSFVSFNISLNYSRSLKVIRNDTFQQGMCKSLLDSIVTIYLVPFLIISMTLKSGLGSFNVVENGTIR